MALANKLLSRLSDPVFYRKRWTQITKSSPARSPQPTALADLPEGPVLVAIAHPDDESFCSGLLCELATTRDVTIFCTTRGEGGNTGDVSRDQLGETREAEFLESCRELGIDSLHFGDYIDPLAGDYRIFAPTIPPGELEHRLAAFSPSIIITHGSGGEYWHPAHLQLHDAVRTLNLPTLTLNAWNPQHPLPHLLNRHDPADLVFDGNVHQIKRLAAVRAHQTQTGYFEEVAESTENFIAATAIESYTYLK